MYNAMYPSSHVVVQYHHHHHQQVQHQSVEGRRMGRHQQQTLESLQLMNFEVPPPLQQQQHQQGRRREPPGYRQQHHNPVTVMPPPQTGTHHHHQVRFRPVFNRMTNYSNTRFLNGKHSMGRHCHGISVPCLSTAVNGGDESSDSGLSSRSPTPNRLHQSSREESSEESLPGADPNKKRGPLAIDKSRAPEQDDENEEDDSRSRVEVVQSGRLHHSYLQPRHHHQYHHSQSYRRNDHQMGGGYYFGKRRVSPLSNTAMPPGGRFVNHNHHHNNRGHHIDVTVHVTSPFSMRYLSPPFNTAPDRFYARADQIEVKKTPSCLTDGSSWDQLSCSIWRKFMDCQQTESTFKKKMMLWKCLYVQIKACYPKYGLYLVGSTLSGFGSNCSDVDMCLIVRHCEIDQRNEAISYLEDILRLLQRCEFIHNAELIQAKVPILKFRDDAQGLEVDLNCNNSVGIRNTHLLYCYGQLDWRVRPLVLVVKLWADRHNINNAKNMTISSYSLALMVIHFLQCGVTPAVLPCLHTVYRYKFQPNTDINSIDIHENLSIYSSDNTQALGELLAKFFQYYADFDYAHNAISVRLGSILPIDECRYHWTAKNDPHQWKYLCIEEPFDLTNTARSVYDPEVFNRIRYIITTSAKLLTSTSDLESIFTFDSDI